MALTVGALARIIEDLPEDSTVEVTDLFGSPVFGVYEVWKDEGTLRISVVPR